MQKILIILVVVVALFLVVTQVYSPSVEEGSSTSTTTTTGDVFTDTSTSKVAKKEVKMGSTIDILGVGINPLELIEESRCPQGVQCIQAGTVRVRALISSSIGTSPQILTLNQPISTEGELVTLIEVKPYPVAGSQIESKNYLFVFEVKKR